MKSLSAEFQAHLDGGTTTLCHCWKLVCHDGFSLGFSDHDEDVEFDGTTFEAVSGIDASAIESSSGLSVDNLDVVGALTSDRLSEGDLAAGRFDDADVEIWKVNWAAPEQRVLMRKGNLGEVARGRAAFRAEIRGLAHKLNQPVGRIYQYTCDASLGDQRCKVGLTSSAYRGVATISTVVDQRVFEVSGLGAYASDWFARGLVEFSSGENVGRKSEVRTHLQEGSTSRLELWQPAPFTLNTSDMLVVFAGCDKTFGTCRSKFANHLNFRGFPIMPGNDFVTSYPRRGEGHSGGSLS